MNSESGSWASRAAATTWMTRMEWPPRAKKLSVEPTRSTPSTLAQMAARAISVGVAGSTNSPSLSAASGSGSALRSTFPLAFSGIESRTVNVAGTM